MVKRLLVIFLFVLSGCGREIVKEPTKVDVPVIVELPKPTIVEQPFLPIESLTEESTDEETAKAYVNTVAILKSYAEQLRAALQPYVESSEKDK